MKCVDPEEIIMVLVLLLMVAALFGATLVLDKRIAQSTPMKFEESEEKHLDQELADDIDDFVKLGADERRPYKPRKD